MTTFFTIMGMLFCAVLLSVLVVWCVVSIAEWRSDLGMWKKVQGENEILKDRVASLEAELVVKNNGPYRVAATPDLDDVIDPPRVAEPSMNFMQHP